MRVHIIFYSLSGNIDVLPVDLHWQHHFREYIHYVLSFNHPLFCGLIYVTVVLEQCVKNLLLHLCQLDVVRVRLLLCVGRDTDSTGRLENTHTPIRCDGRHSLETRELLAFVSGECPICEA